MEELEHRILLGTDARDLETLPDRSVHFVVTSPPYWQLKDYGVAEQIGFHDSYERYVNDLNLVWSECVRVLKPGCRIAVNVGDQFARSELYGRYKVIPIRTEIVRAIESMGLDHMGSIIWRKVTTCHSSGGGSVMGSFPTPRNGVLKLDYEFILLFKKPGRTPPPSVEAKERSAMSTEEWNAWFAGHWEFPGSKQNGHVAMFPEELPRRLIRMFTFPGECVLDPFLGSGTTTLAASRLGRSSIGVELNQGFEALMRDKLAPIGSLDEPPFVLDLTRRGPTKSRLTELEGRLPYQFCDPVKIERRQTVSRKVAVATLRVKRVLAAQRVLLADGRELRLRGIFVPEDKSVQAVRFLEERLKGHRVLLKDVEAEGAERCAYLLLDNRTNLNAHLIKQGLAICAAHEEHPMRERFLKYQRAAGN